MAYLEIINTGFPASPWEIAIDGWLVRTPRGKIRCFMTDTAAIRALRKEVTRRGLDYTVPHQGDRTRNSYL